jgi:hypothetical protein
LPSDEGGAFRDCDLERRRKSHANRNILKFREGSEQLLLKLIRPGGHEGMARHPQYAIDVAGG